MEINIKSENTIINKYILYEVKQNRKIKVCQGIFNDNKCLNIKRIENYEKYLLVVYPKYLSKLKWFVVWMLLSIVELFSTWFGSFGSDSKMYKEFLIDVDDNIEQIDLIFNRPRFDLSTTTNGICISEKVKGKLISILISFFGLLLFVLLIFTIVFLQIYFRK